MSFCRWSSDDFQSDVYIYGSVTGPVIHVAGNRLVFDRSMLPEVPEYHGIGEDGDDTLFAVWFEAWYKRRDAVMQILRDETKYERVEITLPHAGESFYFDDDAEGWELCAQQLVELEKLGYHIPDGVIDAVRSEPDTE